jgi:hypothetical protein
MPPYSAHPCKVRLGSLKVSFVHFAGEVLAPPESSRVCVPYNVITMTQPLTLGLLTSEGVIHGMLVTNAQDRE